MNRFYLIALGAIIAAPALVSAQIPEGYYDATKGLKGAELKDALFNTIKNPNTPGYGPGQGKTWWYFYETDQLPDGTYRNRYSDLVFEVGERGSRPQKDIKGTTNTNGNYVEMNIEHSFPSSWWGGTKNSQYNDLFNLYPSDNSTNSSKSNLVMDKVASVSSDDGYTKIGTGTHLSTKVWEPIDEYKGDFCRGYMYMITAWQNTTWTSAATAASSAFLDNNTYPTLLDWSAKLYSEWCRLDGPDQVEIDRNNTIYKIQGNRNPFIDFPNLFEYLWGDSTAYAFDPEKTAIAGGGTYTPAPPMDPSNPDHYLRMPQIYYADYMQADNDCTQDIVTPPGSYSKVWVRQSKFGWVANSMISSVRYESEGTLKTADIDLSNYTNAYLQFEHAVNYLKTPTDFFEVRIVGEHFNESLNNVVKWPAGNSWTFNQSGVIDLSKYVGEVIHFEFTYTSNAVDGQCGAWEIKNLEVRGGSTTGIDDIVKDSDIIFDPLAPAEYYTIDGRRAESTTKGLIIVRQNGHTFKIVR